MRAGTDHFLIWNTSSFERIARGHSTVSSTAPTPPPAPQPSPTRLPARHTYTCSVSPNPKRVSPYPPHVPPPRTHIIHYPCLVASSMLCSEAWRPPRRHPLLPASHPSPGRGALAFVRRITLLRNHVTALVQWWCRGGHGIRLHGIYHCSDMPL